MTRICDRIFTGSLLFLILLTPFAFGAVEPWAYTAMEVIIFALVIVWMAKRAILARQANTQNRTPNNRHRLAPFALPLALFALLGLFQLIPLPPEILKIISPQTYEVYKQSLPGWPESVPYAELEQTTGDRGQTTDIGHQSSVSGQRTNGNDATNAINADLNTQNPIPNTLFPATWLPLSISAGLTKIDLLKFIAFAALFFLVWRYPFEEEFEDFGFRNSNLGFFVLSPEQRFLRSVLIAILATGVLVAAFGFIERFAWNGDILLFVAGYGSGAVASDTVARASGPFINPDHFANYLSLIFPLALGCALFRTFMVPKEQQYGLKIFCGFTTFLLFTGILLSLSRGAWISTLLGVAIFAWLPPWQRAETREPRSKREAQSGFSVSGIGSWMFGRTRSRERSLTPNTQHPRPHGFSRVARLSAVTVCILLIVSLFFAGSGGREQVDLRLTETMEQSDLGLGARVDVILKDVPKMIVDFPLLGVGLGAWPELFLRYRSGPWSPKFFREAHNDYLEVFAETGFIGFGLLAGFFFVAGKRLVRGLTRASSKHLPLIAGIVAALGGMALHEWLDFNLQIPANAFLFTVLLALGMRLATSAVSATNAIDVRGEGLRVRGYAINATNAINAEPNTEYPRPNTAPRFPAFQPAIVAVAAVFLIAASLRQDQSSYPFNLREMTSLGEAQELLLKHPTHSPYHLSVVRLAGESAPLEWQLTQAKAALWNEPANPSYRDFYAAILIAMGETEEGLKEVTRSIAESPSLSTHAYLSPENLPLLTEEEQAAAEEGFKQALARSYPEAANGLADFYAKLERFADQAALYEQAALKENDRAKKTALLINAGQAYLKEDVRREGLGVRGHSQNPEPNTQHRTPAQRAERAFRAAIAANPSDPKPYHHLLTAIFAVRKKILDGAAQLVADGIKNGAPALPLYLSFAEAAHKLGDPDEATAALESAKAEVDKLIKTGESPHPLYIALADGARRAGDREQESAALLKALDRQPRSLDTLMRLANVYLEKQNFDRATMYLNRVVGISPNSADLYYRIAQTEEARYHFAAAGRAYARAIELAPSNESYRERYEEFKLRVERNRELTSIKSP
jgi:hypothetical protein